MCGRFVSTSSPAALAAAFQVEEVPVQELPPRFNVAPTDLVYAVTERRSESGAVRALEVFRWGLVPSWSKGPSGGARMINARADTVVTKPTYRAAFAKRRTIIPLDCFYEWQPRLVPGVKMSPKQPWAIRRRDRAPMAAAGLWEAWRDTDGTGEWLLTCTIITTAPNDLMSPIHDRMPVVLPHHAVDRWLDHTSEPGSLVDLLVPCPVAALEAWPVSTEVNRVGTEGPHLLEPAELLDA